MDNIICDSIKLHPLYLICSLFHFRLQEISKKDERSQVWQRYANYLLEAIHAHREGVSGYIM
jgi:hypothetical protein